MSGFSVQINTGVISGSHNIHTWITITGPNGSESWGFYPATNSAGNIIYGPGDVRREPDGSSATATSGKIVLTKDQFDKLNDYVRRTDRVPPNYSIPMGLQCSNWAVRGLAEAGVIPEALGPSHSPNPITGPLRTIIWNPIAQQAGWFYRDAWQRLLGRQPKPAGDIRAKTSSASSIPSPIVLDLDADGVETTSVSSGGTYFDHAADGFAERTGWVDADDGLLVRDLNGNGQIDSGRELFGSETLAQAGVQSIATGYANSSYIDPQGNQHRQVGSYTTRTGQTRTATDIWVKTDPMLSIATDWLEVPDQIAELPDVVGYRLVRDLHQAMAVEALERFTGHTCKSQPPASMSLAGQKCARGRVNAGLCRLAGCRKPLRRPKGVHL